jgi:hypothetical protein
MNEEIKQPLLIGAICGASTVMLYQVIFNSFNFTYGKMAIALLLGLVAAGAGFGITFAMTRNR